MHEPCEPTGLNRRAFLAAAGVAAAAAVLSACDGGEGGGGGDSASPVPDGGGTSTVPQSTPGATTATAPATAQFVSSGPSRAKQVALTFHTDGDLTRAQQVLDALADGKAKATCFVVGSWLDQNRSWAQKIAGAGHELANHTYSHPTFADLSSADMLSEIERCRDLLVQLTGSGGAFFRPSGTDDGITSPSPAELTAATQASYRYVLGYDVDPLDYRDPGADAVASRVLDTVKPGSILSLHFNHSGTIAALPMILTGLQQRGLEPVTASTLLAIP